MARQIPNANGYQCPHCGTDIDNFTSAVSDDDARPRSGAITVCDVCAAVAVFVEGGLAPLSEAALADLPSDAQALISTARQAVKKESAPFPPGYVAAVYQMRRAAKAWTLAHPCAQLNFERLPDDVLIIGGLNEANINRIACNEPARELLRVMDKATNGQGTVLQARAALETLFANGPSA